MLISTCIQLPIVQNINRLICQSISQSFHVLVHRHYSHKCMCICIHSYVYEIYVYIKNRECMIIYIYLYIHLHLHIHQSLNWTISRPACLYIYLSMLGLKSIDIHVYVFTCPYLPVQVWIIVSIYANAFQHPYSVKMLSASAHMYIYIYIFIYLNIIQV